MALHTLKPERATLHGQFSREFAPILTIDSGDTVRFETLDAAWTIDPTILRGQPGRHFEPRDPVRDAGHALCGPVAIRGAEPGMTLEVEIGEIRVGTWGWTVAGGWPHSVNDRLKLAQKTDECFLEWALDPNALMGTNQHGHQVKLRPFLGVMGMPPDLPGLHSTAPPRVTGGNMDCKELSTGTTLYLPIDVPGGLFSAGDGHAVQGDGEASVTAIECPIEYADLTFRLRDDLPITTPRARTSEGWLTLGFHENLEEATFLALDAMLTLINEQYGLPRAEALALASLVVDLRITQLVNGVRGVHAVLRLNDFTLPNALK